MTENQNYMPPIQEEEEMTIDWMEYARKLWNIRKLLIKVFIVASIIGVVIAWSTPRNYIVTVTLAPEMTGKGTSRSMANFASMLGISGMGQSNESDALNVMLYPEIVSSTPFMLDLLDTPIQTMNEEQPDTTLVGYMNAYTSSSLVGTVMSIPSRAIGSVISFFKDEEEKIGEKKQPNAFHLTKEEHKTIESLRSLITSNVDKKTGVTTISVSMQDPMVAAVLTDTVLVKLKEHITHYRVAKAQDDLVFWEKIYEQRKKEYYDWQQKYAEYADANKNVILESVRIEQARLQNEANLAYQIYNQVATQLQNARAKVQEAKPAFAVVEPASVPLKPAGPSRKKILIGIIFFALAGTAGWKLFGEDKCKELVKTFREEKKDENLA